MVAHVVTKPGRPTIRPTFQFHGATECVDDNQFDNVVRAIIAWLNRKYPEKLPVSCGDAKYFEDNHYGQSVDWVSLDEPKVWTCRLVQPDAPYKDRQAVPGRNWITEIAVSLKDGILNVYTKILCSSLSYGDQAFSYSRPRFLLDLKKHVVFDDVVKIKDSPMVVDSDVMYERFFNLVFSPKRRLPVLVLTQPDKNKFRVPVSDFLVDVRHLARLLEFSAHVVQLYGDYCYRLTSDIGKAWSVFGGAARIYWPEIDLDVGSAYDHDLYFPERILFWRKDDDFSEKAFERHVYDVIMEHNAKSDVDFVGVASVQDAKLLFSSQRIKQAKGNDELMLLYKDDNKQLRNKIEKLRQDIDVALELAREYEVEKNQYKSDLEKSKLLAKTYREHLERSSGRNAESYIETRGGYDELGDWVVKNISDRLELHQRAIRALKNAQYNDPSLVYKSLLALAFQYRNMRLRVEGAKDDFEKAINNLGVECRQSISKERSGEEGDQYFVQYPSGSQNKVFIKWHLRKGTSHDEKYCMAIYFFWDDLKGKVVVCWLPSHLDNRMT